MDMCRCHSTLERQGQKIDADIRGPRLRPHEKIRPHNPHALEATPLTKEGLSRISCATLVRPLLRNALTNPLQSPAYTGQRQSRLLHRQLACLYRYLRLFPAWRKCADVCEGPEVCTLPSRAHSLQLPLLSCTFSSCLFRISMSSPQRIFSPIRFRAKAIPSLVAGNT